MLFLQFFGERHYGLPDDLAEIYADPDLYRCSTETQYHEFACKYKAFRHLVKEGKLGKTPQFWMIYLDLMRNENMIHLAVQENDFDSRLHVCLPPSMLPSLTVASTHVAYRSRGRWGGQSINRYENN